MKDSISLDEAIAFLNELLAIDGPAIAALIANRVPCNQTLAEHPTVQVSAQHGGYHVGLLGIINGLFGTIDGVNGPILTKWQDGNLIGFAKVEVYPV